MTHALVLLDLGNVLLDLRFDRFIGQAVSRGRRSAAEIQEQWLKGPTKAEYERGHVATEEYFDRLANWLGWPANHRRELESAWSDVFDENPIARAGLACLRAHALVWILSDTDPTHAAHFLRHYPWISDANRLVFSYLRGMLKADPGAFEALVRQAGVPASRILFLDDDERNVAAACESGIDGRLFTGWDAVLKSLSLV